MCLTAQVDPKPPQCPSCSVLREPKTALKPGIKHTPGMGTCFALNSNLSSVEGPASLAGVAAASNADLPREGPRGCFHEFQGFRQLRYIAVDAKSSRPRPACLTYFPFSLTGGQWLFGEYGDMEVDFTLAGCFVTGSSL